VDVFAADLSAQAEVRRLAGEVLDAYPRLDALVNYVGGSWAHRHLTADGLEHTFALNHLAPFLLTNLLLDRLRASGPARVITVSSGAQSMGRIDFEDLQGVRRYSGQRAYNQSKLANVMFTYELARMLDGTGVTATVLHPGVVRTRFGAEDRSRLFKILNPCRDSAVRTRTAAMCGVPRRAQASARSQHVVSMARPGSVLQTVSDFAPAVRMGALLVDEG
jgi:NAD(P)-dependent dehydrogenase (short-subunit alcohol dehydrogenase family)